jgi:glycosyltransferase involved in cell wall biosynthesis
MNVSNKKKILIMVDWFTPGYKAGGPIQSCHNIALALKNDYDIYILTTDTDHGDTEPYKNIEPDTWLTNIDPVINIYYARKKTLSFGQLAKEIHSLQADYVYLNHLFSPYFVLLPLWLKYASKIKGKVIVCPRGALYDSALSVKRYKKIPFLLLLKRMRVYKKVLFHATNSREKEAIEKYFPGSQVIIANNLPKIDQKQYISCEKIAGKIKCVFIARIVAIKNLLFLLSALEKVKAIVELTIIGPQEDEVYWEECKKRIEQLPDNISVEYAGTKQNSELSLILQQHHLFILPTTGENFGHSIFEALSAGRPVLISDQTPWLGLNSKKAGWDLPLNNISEFSKVIEESAGWDQHQFDEYGRGAWQYAHQFITNPDLIKEYHNLFAEWN